MGEWVENLADEWADEGESGFGLFGSGKGGCGDNGGEVASVSFWAGFDLLGDGLGLLEVVVVQCDHR